MTLHRAEYREYGCGRQCRYSDAVRRNDMAVLY